jgi:hypothetical protein
VAEPEFWFTRGQNLKIELNKNLLKILKNIANEINKQFNEILLLFKTYKCNLKIDFVTHSVNVTT